MSELEFDRIVYFGDSLTDTGAVFDLTSQTLLAPFPSPLLGYDGVFSNGPVHAQILPDLLELETTSYAVGGARALGSQTLEDLIVRNDAAALIIDPDDPLLDLELNFLGQLQRAQEAETGDLSGTAAAFFIGSNDYNAFFPSLSDPFGADLVQNVVGAQLAAGAAAAQAGVDTLIYYTLPAAPFFPSFQTETFPRQILGDFLFTEHNRQLTEGLDALADTAVIGDTDIMLVDTEYLSLEILADPSAFGIIAPLDRPVVDTERPPLEVIDQELLASFDEDQILFWDPVHPTTAVHGIISAFTAATLTTNLTLGTEADEDIQLFKTTDTVFGSDGSDTIGVRFGDDTVIAGLGDDVVEGGTGNDVLGGGSGDDDIRGGAGTDVLAGGDGDDMLFGGNDNDTLIDGLGSDTVRGGQGDDVFLFTEATLIGGEAGIDSDLFLGGDGFDILFLALSEETQEALGPIQTPDFVIEEIGLEGRSIELVVVVDSRTDLPQVASTADLTTADLWGFV